MTKFANIRQEGFVFGLFENWDFEFVSEFGIRISSLKHL
jgi:hypothetical protein